MYKAKRVKKIKIEIDGNVYDWAFSNYALSILDEEFEEGSIKIITQAKKKPVSTVSKLIYAGIKFSAEEQGLEISYPYIANSMLFDTVLVNKIMNIVKGTVNTKESLTGENVANEQEEGECEEEKN